ncbi:X-domain of DnaJ-containing-domain-containing protein [Lactarius hatsudake]|nr:X-domain of DnaJ-containing-domain-containing protein [Lactarius hatsudake]
MAPVETEYYDLVSVLSFATTHSVILSSLGVPVDVNDTEFKKAYRKAAMRYHPGKNSSPDAEEKFKEMRRVHFPSSLSPRIVPQPQPLPLGFRKADGVVIGPSDRICASSMTRTTRRWSARRAQNVEDAASFFANVFGGERFMDCLGDLSLMNDMTNVANTMLSEEEKAEVPSKAAPAGAHEPSAPSSDEAARPLSSYATPEPRRPGALSLHLHPAAADKRGRGRQQRLGAGDARVAAPEEALQDDAGAARGARGARAGAGNARSRCACNPGGPWEPETAAWEARMRREADDLKLESFGVELLHAIETVYVTKTSGFLKSRKFLGIPGLWSQLKEKGAVAKDAWGVIGSAYRAQLKGDVCEEELKALEIDVTGKIMLASWRRTHFEVVQVLREIVDNVLKDHSANDQELYHRARGLLLLGAIFKSTVPDESD